MGQLIELFGVLPAVHYANRIIFAYERTVYGYYKSFAASEDAYERATQEGYAENPAVIAAVAALKSAWTALRVANFNLMTAKGFFRVAFAGWRAARARRKTREACINLQAAIEQAAAENRLYNRRLILSSRPAT